MKKTVKMIAVAVAVIMLVALVASCAAPAEVKEKAEEVKEAVSEKAEEVKEAAADKAEEITEKAAEDIIDIVISGSSVWPVDNSDGRYSEGEFSGKDDSVVAIYIDRDEQVDIVVRQAENPKGIALEGYATEFSNEVHGCFDKKDIAGLDAYLVSYFKVVQDADGNDLPLIIKSYIVENEDGFMHIEYCFRTCRTQVGTSDYSAWIPVVYNQSEDRKSDILQSYTYPDGEGPYTLSDIAVTEMKTEDYTYDKYLERAEKTGLKDIIPEDRFNDWAEDGWDLEDISEYYNACYGEAVTDNYIITNDYGVKVLINGMTYNNGKDTLVTLSFIDGDTIEHWTLSGETVTWPSTGEAFAWSFHETPEEEDDEFSDDAE